MIEIGASIGRYHILSQLGQGGMATVYKAFDTRLECEVALKEIRIEQLAPAVLERALKRFEREAKAVARLNHPNIVKVFDYGEINGSPFMVMPLINGGTLKSFLKQNGMIPWKQAIEIIVPIAEALEYSHSMGIIHRDVKPSNILLTDKYQPMLADFGVAKVMDEEVTQDLTGTSASVGTPEYMAPEQITSKSIDKRADIYSLGITLYQMVTGHRPFEADTPLAVLLKHASEPLLKPSVFVNALPKEMDSILLKALAKNPSDRFQSMHEFSESLMSLYRGEKVTQLTDRRIFRKGLWAILAGVLVVSIALFFLLRNGLPVSTDKINSTEMTSEVTFTFTTVPTTEPSQTAAPKTNWILFAKVGDMADQNFADLMMLNIDDLSKKEVKDTGIQGEDFLVSPKGDEVLVKRYSNLYLQNFFSNALIPVTNSKTFVGNYGWSPDGNWILYEMLDINLSTTQNISQRDLYLVNRDDLSVEQLTDNIDVISFAWATDSQKIAFTYEKTKTGLYGLQVYDRNLKKAQIISEEDQSFMNAVWTIDNNAIIFNKCCSTGGTNIFRINSDGSNSKQLTYFDYWTTVIEISPDGKTLLFESGASGTSSFYTMDLETLQTKYLADGDQPFWSPDGSKIFFRTYEKNIAGIYVMNSDGSNIQRILSEYGSVGIAGFFHD